MKQGSRWSQVTPMLLFTVLTVSWANVMYGLDTGSFGSLQALPSWLRSFGTRQANGTYSLPTQQKSIINSVVWAGKGLGCLLFEPIVSRIGYKKLLLIVMVLQVVGVIVELAATNWGVFSAGRVIAYLAVGLVENAAPSYESEIAPAALRGFITGSLIMLTTLGNMWGGLMSRGFQHETQKIGWIIPTAMQFVPVIFLLVGLPFIPESPRWLVAHGRTEEALHALNCLRPKRDAVSGLTGLEVAAFEQAIEDDRQLPSGRFFDIFRGTYFRRLLIAMFMFIFQQTTGGQFLLSYGPTFYIQMGLGDMAFTYNVLLQGISLFGCILTILFLDKIGRRPILVVGTFLQIPFMLLVAGLGTKAHKTASDYNGMVASILLFNFFVKVSLSTNAYLIASEIGGTRMRRKIMGIATCTDVVAAFTVTYSLPYLMGTNGSGVNLGANVGWIFGGISALSFIFVVFCVPELAGRSLEEVDELFDAKIWAWQFKNYKTSGIGAHIAHLEGGNEVEGKEDPFGDTGHNSIPGSEVKDESLFDSHRQKV